MEYSQRLLAELQQVSTRTISEHIINIYSDHELRSDATILKSRLVQTEGRSEDAAAEREFEQEVERLLPSDRKKMN